MRKRRRTNTVYLLRDPATNAYKVGFTSRAVHQRVADFSVGQPRALEIAWSGPGEIRHERALHRVLKRSKIQGEWFADSDLMRIVRTLLPVFGAEWVGQHTVENLCTYVPFGSPYMPNFYRVAKPPYWPEFTDEPYPARASP